MHPENFNHGAKKCNRRRVINNVVRACINFGKLFKRTLQVKIKNGSFKDRCMYNLGNP